MVSGSFVEGCFVVFYIYIYIYFTQRNSNQKLLQGLNAFVIQTDATTKQNKTPARIVIKKTRIGSRTKRWETKVRDEMSRCTISEG